MVIGATYMCKMRCVDIVNRKELKSRDGLRWLL